MASERPTIFVAYPYHFSEADYRSVFSAVREEFEVEFVFADQKITNKHILEKIDAMIGEAEFSLFDITTWNPNVSLELGIAFGRDLDYYILFNPTEHQEDVPADLGGIDRIQYKDFSELRAGVTKLMTQQFGSPEAPSGAEQAGAQVAEQVQGLKDKVPDLVKEDPGLQIGGIASSLGVPVELAQVVVRPLVSSETLVTRGTRRGTRYYLPEHAPAEEESEEGAKDFGYGDLGLL